MDSEHIYTDCDFVKRLVFLCSQKGVEYKEIENLPRILATRLVDAGIVSLLDGVDERDKVIENTRQKIARDIKKGAPIKVEFLDWYCRFFHCSADFIMGYVDTLTYEQKDLQDLTGLPGEAARPLLKKEGLVIDALTDLLTGLDDPEADDPDNIANVRRSLLYDLHVYFTDPGRITGMFSGFDGAIKGIDGHIFATGTGGTMAGFSPDKLPAILMLNIQENLQEIRNDIQKRK